VRYATYGPAFACARKKKVGPVFVRPATGRKSSAGNCRDGHRERHVRAGQRRVGRGGNNSRRERLRHCERAADVGERVIRTVAPLAVIGYAPAGLAAVAVVPSVTGVVRSLASSPLTKPL